MIDINFIDDDFIDDRIEEIFQWIESIKDEFIDSEYFKKLSAVEQECCFFLLDFFFEYSYSYCRVGPGKIDEEVIDEMMLDVMPRKISAELSTFESFAPVMESFLSWCEDNHHMSNTKKLREHIHETSQEMISRSQKRSYWGMAKSMMMGSFSKPNLTISDNEEDDYDDEENGYWVKSGTYRRENEKIGRNDACSCGSGKKYKKCCLVSVNS
jgi:uncharacterized protein YchJ